MTETEFQIFKDTQFLGCVPAKDNKTGENLYVFKLHYDAERCFEVAKTIREYIPNSLFFSSEIDVLDKDEVKDFLSKYFNAEC